LASSSQRCLQDQDLAGRRIMAHRPMRVVAQLVAL